MDFVGLNWMAIIAVTILHFIIGSFWYSPLLFGDKWMKIAGMKKSDFTKKDINKSMIGGFLSSFLVSIVLAMVIVALDVVTFVQGASVGLWLWLGFVVTTAFMPVIYEKKHPMLFKIYIAYEFISFLLMGGILGVWI